MSEANKDLLEKYRKEVALRRKYHEQLVELKGNHGDRQLTPFLLSIHFMIDKHAQYIF